MPVIALTHEMGSLAKDVSLRLGEVANLRVARHEVVDHVAGRMHMPSSLINRVREGKAGLRERMRTDARSVETFTAEEVYDFAQGGNAVLRGWGATMLLRPVSHVVTARVTRPFGQRVDWLVENLGIDRDAAEDEVRRSDHAHASRMHAQFGVTWGDPQLYDLVINMERVSIDSAVAQLLDLAARPEFQPTAASQAKLEGLALAAKVRAALKGNAATEQTNVGIDAEQGKVTLTGLVLDDAELKETQRVAEAVAGAGKVDNRLRVMQVGRKFTYSKT
jgi:cytidylate kinase